jgi:hypothetical protein
MLKALLRAVAPTILEVAGTLVTTLLVELRKKLD